MMMADFVKTDMQLGSITHGMKMHSDSDSDSDMDLYEDFILPCQPAHSTASSLKDPSAPWTYSRRLHPAMEHQSRSAFSHEHPPALTWLWSLPHHHVKEMSECFSISSCRARVCESNSPPRKRLRLDELKADLTLTSTFDSDDENDDASSSDSCYVELDRATQMQPLDPHAAVTDEPGMENNTTNGLLYIELARKKFISAIMEPQYSDSENELKLFEHERRCFDLALAFWKETQGGDYKFMRIVTMCPITTSKGWGTHTYFFAHLKGTNSSPELFFAELVLASVNSVHCCKVNPSSFSLGRPTPQRELIFHCPHLRCFQCFDHCNYEFESGIEVS